MESAFYREIHKEWGFIRDVLLGFQKGILYSALIKGDRSLMGNERIEDYKGIEKVHQGV